MPSFNLLVNRKKYTVDVDPTTPMLWVLRDHLDLVGTKFGCGVGLFLPQILRRASGGYSYEERTGSAYAHKVCSTGSGECTAGCRLH
jgi:hypothetical protein